MECFSCYSCSMKVGYPCINRSLESRANRTFRLASYNEARFRETVASNLAGLQEILAWNVTHGLLYFRIGSEIIPFASHPVCRVDWKREFAGELKALGDYIRDHSIRIAMHPDQFNLLHSPRVEVVERTVQELVYHAEILDALGLNKTAKIQIHVGGVYGDKANSLRRFVQGYDVLPLFVKKRLVIENDDRLYSLADCLKIHFQTGIPVLLDTFHHELLNAGETIGEAVEMAGETWDENDGVLLVDYSTQEPGARIGKHAETIDLNHFSRFIQATNNFAYDVMLEIKDKEKSALAVVELISDL
jgi:UV DNA damage endonuclease